MVQHCEQEKRVWWLSLKKGKHIFVIWLIEQHKENDRSEKSGQIFTHVAMHVSTNFRSVHKPWVIQVTEGKNGLMSVNNLNWKNQFRWV